jgi:hypothetical protein
VSDAEFVPGASGRRHFVEIVGGRLRRSTFGNVQSGRMDRRTGAVRFCLDGALHHDRRSFRAFHSLVRLSRVWHQIWAQFFVSETSDGAKPLKTSGEPGRTRTSNPLIKSSTRVENKALTPIATICHEVRLSASPLPVAGAPITIDRNSSGLLVGTKQRETRSLRRFRDFALSSQRFQELDHGFLVWAFQFFKLLGDVGSLAAVAYDGFEKC